MTVPAMTIPEQAVDWRDEAQAAAKNEFTKRYVAQGLLAFPAAVNAALDVAERSISAVPQSLVGVQRRDPLPCDRCHGTGNEPGYNRVCEKCGGSGVLPHTGQQEEAIDALRAVYAWWNNHGHEADFPAKKIAAALSAAPASPRDDHERDTPVERPIGQEK